MALLWVGSEFENFKFLGLDVQIGVSSYYYDRAVMWHISYSNATRTCSNPLLTNHVNLWASARLQGVPGGHSANQLLFGVGTNGTGGALLVGTGEDPTNFALWQSNANGVFKKLVETSVPSVPSGQVKLDLEITNFGPTGYINLYTNGSTLPLLSNTTNLLWTGASNLNQFILMDSSYLSVGPLSEMLLADEDTRTWYVCTLVPNAAGDNSNLNSGTYVDIDELLAIDADVITANTAGQEAQYNLSNLPGGYFDIKGVKVAYRGTKGANVVLSNWSLGVKTEGTINVSQMNTMNTTWESFERLMIINPVTGIQWTQQEINDLQIAFSAS